MINEEWMTEFMNDRSPVCDTVPFITILKLHEYVYSAILIDCFIDFLKTISKFV